MARLRGAPVVVEWSSANLGRLNRAAMGGCSDDPGVWEPPELKDRQPTRAWCEHFCAVHRDRLRERFADRPDVFLRAWPVAMCDPDPERRATALAVVDAHGARPDPRPALAH